MDKRLSSLQTTENNLHSKQSREEMSNSLKLLQDSLLSRMTEVTSLQKNQLDIFAAQIAELTKANEGKLDKIRDTLNEGIRGLQGDGNLNSKQSREELSNAFKQFARRCCCAAASDLGAKRHGAKGEPNNLFRHFFPSRHSPHGSRLSE